MKIVVISPAWPWRGGIAHHTALLVRYLRRSHEVRVVTFSRQYPGFLFPGSSQRESGTGPAEAPAECLIDSINPFNWIRIGRKLRKDAPDLIIFAYAMPFFGPCFGTIAAVARGNGRTRSLFLCHNIVPHERRPGDRLFTRFAFAFADLFVVQSAAVEQDLLAFKPGARYRVAQHPVYESFGAPIDKSAARRQLGITAKRVMLFFGYIRKYKGLEILLRSMSTLEDVFLLVIGECYEEKGFYERLVQELEIGDRVRLLFAYVPGTEVPVYFSSADVVILPYLSATQSGIAQMAYHFNKPVIASAVGGLSEVVRNGVTGITVPPGNPRALADAIRRFYDEGLEAACSANVEQEKRQYSWDQLVQAIEELARSHGA
jgi:glycosyltransferase involved in cell wall biosynthesis